MSAQYFKSLLFKSARVQQEIDREYQRRLPDWMRLLKLKKLRLSIKDRMQMLFDAGSRVALQPMPIRVRIHKNRRMHAS